MDNVIPLLSICIPTYNRAPYLKDALEMLTADPAFDERVEVVISDNASTDETKSIALDFVKQYSNIYYYRNEINIRDKNFIQSLSRARGKYARLFNDTLRLKPGVLLKMLKIIDASSESDALFFFQNISFNDNVDRIRNISCINDFLYNNSFYTTWIANFGCWKSKIDKINNPNLFSHLQLAQVDWFMQIATTSSRITLAYGDYYDFASPKRKGGYNLFNVFVNNYLYILNEYDFKLKYLIIEKNRLLRYFINQWLWLIYIHKDRYCFETKNKWGILFSHYYLYPLFYLLLLKYFMKKILSKIGFYSRDRIKLINHK